MKNKIIILIILVLIALISIFVHPFIPCLFHEITGLYCPGCGVTRMIISILKLDLYQAFRYNPLLFILFPVFIILFINYIYCLIKIKTPLYKKVNNSVWILLIIILILYGIIRNIYIPLAPTKI